MHFLSLPNEILYMVIQYYLVDKNINPVYVLLICTKLTKIICENNFCGFLKKKYVNDVFLKKIWGRMQGKNLSINYKSSKYYKHHKYYYYSDNLLSSWDLTVCDNLNIKYDDYCVIPNYTKTEQIYVIYHKKSRLSEDELLRLSTKICKFTHHRYNAYEEIFPFEYITLFCFFAVNKFKNEFRDKLRLNQKRYKKNVKTIIKYGKPLHYEKYACHKCIQEARLISDSDDLILCHHFESDDGEPTSVAKEKIANIISKKITKHTECKFFEQILSYNFTLYTKVGKEYTHKIIKAIILNLTPDYYYICLYRTLFDYTNIYHNLVLTNVVYNEICRSLAPSNRQKRKKYSITYQEYRDLITEFSDLIDNIEFYDLQRGFSHEINNNEFTDPQFCKKRYKILEIQGLYKKKYYSIYSHYVEKNLPKFTKQ